MKFSVALTRSFLWLLVLSFVSIFLARPSIANATPDHSTQAPPAAVRLPGHVLPALANARIVPSDAKSESEPITLTLVLKRDNQPAFERYLHELYDPHSNNFHKFLTQDEIARRFGPSLHVYDRTLRYMRANGFALVAGSTNRLTLTMRGTRAEAERLFQVRIRDYRKKDRQFFANDSDPAMPPDLAAHVLTVAGLSNLATPHPEIDAIVNLEGPVICGLGVLTCVEISQASRTNIYNKCITAYKQMQAGNFAGLVNLVNLECAEQGAALVTGLDLEADAIPAAAAPFSGAGQKIGLLEFDTFQPSDVSDFLHLIGASSTQINKLSEVKVNGGATAGPNQSEVLLDIDTVMTIATGANVVVYDAPFDGRGSFQALFNQMVTDKVTVISNSWAYCEDQTSLSDVEGIDTIFQTAEAGGISIFNGSGDTGSTCLDGAPNTVAVPADSPNATAVGGSSLTTGPGSTYLSESWWDGTHDSPPTGQGGFGTSKFFATPPYQTGLTGAHRSIPDVVVNADPAKGVMICQASGGGCPSGLLYGGTSFAAPEWAGFIAVINEALGSNLGNLNPLMYAKPGAFHNAASMTPASDFAHVGLGSPNLDDLFLALSGKSAGAADAAASTVTPYVPLASPYVVSGPAGVFADGTTTGNIVVQLLDTSGNSVVGKSISLSAANGTPTITPASALTDQSGTAVFALSDSTVETPKLTATDTTDSLQLSTKPTLPFVGPPAASASINEAPPDVNNDGKTTATITVTLKDSLGHASPGKMVNLAQTGSSVISGPTPQVTDGTGHIQFTATDLATETVTYTAVDVTDGNLPVPGSASATFTGSPDNTCGSGLPPAAPGFVVTPYATGFSAQNVSFGDVNFGCAGAAGIAFDASGNLFVNEFPTGNIYKFPPGGGVAGPATKLNNSSLGVSLNGLAFDSLGNLYASRDATTGDFTTGAVMQINPATGAVTRTISAGLTCPSIISIDPLSEDLFTDDSCTGAGSDNASIWRVTDPDGASPSTSVYTTLPHTPNATLAFAPGGTIYAWAFSTSSTVGIAMVSGTNGPATPTVNILPGIQLAGLGLLAGGTGAGTFLIANPFVNSAPTGIGAVDLTTSPPTLGTSFAMKSGANYLTFGPDGCIYGAQLTTVFKITDTSGGCTYGATLASPTLVLSPTSVSPNPAQGTPQTFDAALHYVSSPAGKQIVFSVQGANPQSQQVAADANGLASFTYTAGHAGVDTISAATIVSSNPVNSNPAVVTWGPGSDTTFVSLNLSPKGGIEGQTVNLIASLTDVSQTPAVALSGKTIDFAAGSQHCSASTNPSGIATCSVTASGLGVETQTATFAGTSGLLASNASDSFNVITLATPTATATATATPTATPTPVAGKLKITPKSLNFGSVAVGTNPSPTKSVTITNASKAKKKKHPLPILIEMETGVTSPFRVTSPCNDDDLTPRSKGMPVDSCTVTVEFTPTAKIKYSGTLVIDTNLVSKPDRSVKLSGTGK